MGKYLEIEYPTINDKYVFLLAYYLRTHYFQRNGSLLDIGSGTGHYTQCFSNLGLLSDGIDKDFCNFEEDDLPYQDSSFLYVFSKSTLEHIQNTEHILSETKRVLIKDGLALFLVPDWNSQWQNFYDDSTHIKPFTLKGLEQAFKLAGFKDVKSEYFYQLPFLWDRPYLRWIPHIVSLLPESTKYRREKQNKLIRFSKERMLLLTASA